MPHGFPRPAAQAVRLRPAAPRTSLLQAQTILVRSGVRFRSGPFGVGSALLGATPFCSTQAIFSSPIFFSSSALLSTPPFCSTPSRSSATAPGNRFTLCPDGGSSFLDSSAPKDVPLLFDPLWTTGTGSSATALSRASIPPAVVSAAGECVLCSWNPVWPTPIGSSAGRRDTGSFPPFESRLQAVSLSGRRLKPGLPLRFPPLKADR